MHKQAKHRTLVLFGCLWSLAIQACTTEKAGETTPLLSGSLSSSLSGITITSETEKRLKELLPVDLWHHVMEYLEGDNSFLNHVLARIFVPSAQVQKTILTSFGAYLAHASEEQRMKALSLFYKTVRYAHKHALLCTTAPVAQRLVPAVQNSNFTQVKHYLQQLDNLPSDHASYLLEHSIAIMKEKINREHQIAPSGCHHCFYCSVGIVITILSIIMLARSKPLNFSSVSDNQTTIICFNISLVYWLCYSLVSCYCSYRLDTLKQVLHTLIHKLEQQVAISNVYR